MDDGREQEMVAWFREHEMTNDEQAATCADGARASRTSLHDRELRSAPEPPDAHRISENPLGEPPRTRRRVAEETERVDIRELARAGVFRRDPSCPPTITLSSGLELEWEVHRGIGDTQYLHLSFHDPRPLPDPTLELALSQRGFGVRAAVRCPGLIIQADAADFCHRRAEVMYLVQGTQRGWEILCRSCAGVTYQSQRVRGTLPERYRSDQDELDRALAEVTDAMSLELAGRASISRRSLQRHRALVSVLAT